MLVAEKKITVEDFRQMTFEGEEDAFYELINGEIMKKSAPTSLHQDISDNLHFLLNSFVRPRKLGKVYAAPLDVYLHRSSHVLPDLIFVPIANKHIVDPANGVVGVPDILIEIISPSSIYKDRVLKNNDYEASGVPEYWLVDSKNQSIEVYENMNGEFRLFAFAAEMGKVQSKVLAGFEVDIREVFS